MKGLRIFFLTLLAGCVLPAPQQEPVPQPAPGNPKAPLFTLEGGSIVDSGRFEFGKIPELLLIRGLPQVVQLGFYQIDPANPWTPGDLDRSLGWLSNRFTRLVDAASGQPVTMFGYDERTGELSYSGAWSGDVTVRLMQLGGTVQSLPFRIRVISPTVVYGDNAVAINAEHGWAAVTCPADLIKFGACKKKFKGGATDVAPLVIYITPGSYAGQDWHLADRPYTYVIGDPGNRPTLANDDLAGGKKAMFYIANLNLINVNITLTHALPGRTNDTVLRNLRQCCETAQNNGYSNPNKPTYADQWNVYWHQSESRGMGGTGNTTHAAYVEGRPNSLFDVNNIRVLGTRGSSAVKTTVAELNVRHSLFTVAESADDLANGTCATTGYSSGCLMHTPIDVPGYSSVVIYGNRFEVWRGSTVGATVGRSGVLAGTIFFRLRLPTLGSDVPNYPNISWNPPVSSQRTDLSPCLQWASGPATFTDDKFWRDVRAVPLADPLNPCTFKHYVSFNTFVQLPGSLPLRILRDDGTYPAKVTSQFSPFQDILRNHPLWAERSTSLLYGNTNIGFLEDQEIYQLDDKPNVRNVDPLAFWPRSEPEDFPRVLDDLGKELPPWFKL